MTPTTANNNSTASSQTAQFSFNGPKPGSTSPLASLASATEPSNLSSNQQQPPVATFPQRTPGGSATANTPSVFGSSFSQTHTSGPMPSFSFTNSSSADASAQPFSNPPSGKTPYDFSFPNASSGNLPSFTFNLPTSNSQVRPSITITPSTQKQGTSHNKQPSPASLPLTFTNNPKERSTANETTTNNGIRGSQKLSDPPTPISQQSSFPSEDQEENDTPDSLAENSLLGKKLNTKLFDSADLVVDRSDPTSPLYSLRSFQELNLKPDLLKGIYNMGFQTPSKIQEIALPNLINNPPKNLIAQSQSGTGKTAAFALAILSRIDPSIQSPQALILAPTFELAVQTGSVIERMAQFLPYIHISYAVRDRAMSKRNSLVRGQLLTEPIVIGTPGTVEEWCHRLRVIDLSKLRMCCVDEADVMIAMEGFQKICVDLVNGLNRTICQMMLFSATYSDEVMTFAREIVENPLVLRLKREKQALSNIRQFFIRCYDAQQKFYAIEQIYANLTVGQTIVFCRTKAAARDLAVRMANQQHSVRELTSALEIEQRASIINQFREGIFRVLISTNVTARGIDIDDVSLVINYDMPVTTTFQPDFETYLHRIGRCGRFGRLGYTFNLIGSEKDFHIMQAIEQYFAHTIDEITIDDISNLEQNHE